jgi:hypothetical protein
MSSALADTIDLAAFETWLRDQLDDDSNITDTAKLTGATQNRMLRSGMGRARSSFDVPPQATPAGSLTKQAHSLHSQRRQSRTLASSRGATTLP